MSSLIELDKLIKQAKKEGVDFGKGDPYNRLRYYTKIGWLPHMARKKAKDGEVKGHYPKWVLDRLLLIEKYKNQGLSNEQISEKLKASGKLQNIVSKMATPEFKNKVISYATVGLLIVILLNELELISISKSKVQSVTDVTAQESPAYIVDSGTSFVPSNKNRIFVKNNEITGDSKVYVTFNQNFSPATRYWVSRIEAQEGFFVELDAPVFDNVEFSWWISK